MEIKAQYKDRQLSFTAGDRKGDSLDELISFIGKNKKDIAKLDIHGESDSYTFLRQVYLFANMVSVLSGVEVCINSRKISASKPAFPTYS